MKINFKIKKKVKMKINFKIKKKSKNENQF